MMSSALSTSIEARQQTRRLKSLFGDASAPARPRPCCRRWGGWVSGWRPICCDGARRRKEPRAARGLPARAGVPGAHRGNNRTAIGAIKENRGRAQTLFPARRGSAGTRRRPRGHRGHAHHSVASVEVRRNGVNVKRSFGALPPIFAYVGELNQVWTNLIHNAIQAMDGRGEIVIETRWTRRGARSRSRTVGPGIAADACRAIFEPFFTTKAKGEGTGLGLSHLRRASSRSTAATIRVDSRPGRTRFEVRLPIEGRPSRGPRISCRVRGALAIDAAGWRHASAARAHRLRRRRGGRSSRRCASSFGARFGHECDIAVAKNARRGARADRRAAAATASRSRS